MNMKKSIGVLIALAVLPALTFLGCKKEPVVLTGAQVNQTLEAHEPSIEDTGFSMPVKNKSSQRVKAQIYISASVEQNGDEVKHADNVITETWEPQEEKRIFIPYKVNKYYNSSGAHNVSYSVNAF
jgi:hypothetical protein